MEKNMYYIGVDLGTSSVKLLLMDKQDGCKNGFKRISDFVSKARLVRTESV